MFSNLFSGVLSAIGVQCGALNALLFILVCILGAAVMVLYFKNSKLEDTIIDHSEKTLETVQSNTKVMTQLVERLRRH